VDQLLWFCQAVGKGGIGVLGFSAFAFNLAKLALSLSLSLAPFFLKILRS
jgi:hypothetical protein